MPQCAERQRTSIRAQTYHGMTLSVSTPEMSLAIHPPQRCPPACPLDGVGPNATLTFPFLTTSKSVFQPTRGAREEAKPGLEMRGISLIGLGEGPVKELVGFRLVVCALQVSIEPGQHWILLMPMQALVLTCRSPALPTPVIQRLALKVSRGLCRSPGRPIACPCPQSPSLHGRKHRRFLHHTPPPR